MSLIVDIKKRFPRFTLAVSFRAENERVGILGASGCGKTMTLKCIAGIETPDEGKIVIDGLTVFDSSRGINLPPQMRKTGYLFQNYALFPTMTLAQNLAIVLHKLPRMEREALIEDTLRKMHLENHAHHYPARLSGGEQQRAALARILVSKPQILMLDEPFSALDSFLQSEVEQNLLESLKSFPGTTLFVSHDRDEVYRICEKMQILQEGRIVGSGKKEDLFKNPGTLAAARLTGCKNIAAAKKIGASRIVVPAWGVFLDTAQLVPDDLAYIGIRAHHIRPAHPEETQNCFEFQIERYDASPFSLTEYITALTPQEIAGDTRETRQKIVRKVSDTEGSINTEILKNNGKLRLCFPREHLLFLRD